MKSFIKRFTASNDKKRTRTLATTTFDGSRRVIVVFPYNPTKKQFKEIYVFLSDELDDHDAAREFLGLIKKDISVRYKDLPYVNWLEVN